MDALVPLIFAGFAAVWSLAVWQAVKVVQAVKPGQRFSLFFPGWPWNVEKAVARYGRQVEAPLRAFQRTFFVFFGATILVAALAMVFATGQGR